MHGWLILDKPVGLGSTSAVSAVKRALREGGYPKVKVGHGGTLDPLASGVLPIAIGEATKLAGRLLDSDKVYDFTVALGIETDTLDAEGREIARSEVRPYGEAVAAILPRFTGAIEQVPPAYSALKVDGARAYDLARAGEEVTLASRAVTIHSLRRQPDLGSGQDPQRAACDELIPKQVRDDGLGRDNGLDRDDGLARDDPLEAVTLTAHVSKGTYIRSLARDIAQALGTVGHVTMLRRTRAGPFTLTQAISLDILADAAKRRTLEEHLLPLRAGLDDIPALSLSPDQAGLLRQGRVLIGTPAQQGLNFAVLGDTPVALVEASGHDVRVVRGFNFPAMSKDQT